MSIAEQTSHAHTMDLHVTGMSCQGCVSKVRTAIESQDTDAEVIGYPKDERLVVISKLSLEEVTQSIEASGYHYQGLNQGVNAEEVPTTTYHVSGMSCQGCVSKVRKSVLEKDPLAEVTGFPSEKRLAVTSLLSPSDVESAVVKAGYEYHGLAQTLPEHDESITQQPSSAQEPVNNQTPSSDTQETAESLDEQAHPSLDSEEGIQLSLSGITCAGCVNTIQKALDGLANVDHAEVNFASRTAQVSGSASAEELINAVENAGYGAKVIEDPAAAQAEKEQKELQEYHQKVRYSIAGLLVGVPLMAWGLAGGSMHVATHTDQLIWGSIGLLSLVVMIYAGRHYYRSAWRAFTHRHSNMDTLIAIGTGSAWLYSIAVVIHPEWLPSNARHLYFEASTMILGLINLGQALEVRARGKTSAALKRLLDLRPNQATVIRDGKAQSVDVAQIEIGEHIRIKAGDKLPVDGEIVEGTSSINESMLTGEPVPIEKASGDTVSAGTINGNGSFTYRATKVGGDTLLAQIITMVGKAQNSKPPISRLADQVSSIFVPSVMIIAVLAALAWFNFGPEPVAVNMLVAAVSVLIIACPCALGLATPISTMIGVGKAAEYGGLIRNGDALQKASEITTIVLDKTGTITEGEPRVTQADLEPANEAFVKQVVQALEAGANHPLAQALLNYASDVDEQEQKPLTVKQFNSVTGQGVTGVISGTRYMLGNATLIRESGLDTDAYEQSGIGSSVYLASESEIVASFTIEDEIKASAPKAIAHLHRENIRVIMLTGDNEKTAQAVAERVNIDTFKANMRPQDKLEYVKQLQAQGAVVGMIGDGINDAPALAQADVGFAMGGGTDVAMESADITLIGNDLNNIANVIAISKATLSNIKQNLWGAFGYNSLGIPVAAGLLFPFTGWLLSPVIAGAAMSLSSVTVVLNANRLRLFKPHQEEDRKS